jgi:ferredoxin
LATVEQAQMMIEPESPSAWLPSIDPRSCTACGDCIPACPAGALSLDGSRVRLARPQGCDYCGACELACPAQAITLLYQIVLGVG